MASQQRMFERVAILGLGLMGGSLGLALRERGLADTVAGYDTAETVADRAKQRGAIDESCADVQTAVRGADLVVLAVPVLAMAALIEALRARVEPNAVVTDLGSVKWPVTEWATVLWPVSPWVAGPPQSTRFVGGHPMAGSEQSGIDAAASDLFEGAKWCLTPTERTDPDALNDVTELVNRLGAVPYIVAPRTHDRLVAGVSHLPILAAAALVRSLAASSLWNEMMDLAAGGFRDTTRVASGDPIMARDISLANAAHIVPLLDAYIRELRRLRAELAGGDRVGIEQDFRAARDAREGWLRRQRSDAPRVASPASGVTEVVGRMMESEEADRSQP